MTDEPAMRGLGRHKRDEHGILLGDHRCTPPEIWQAALRAIGQTRFDLDPASNPHSTVPAGRQWMGPLDGNDGLQLAWHGEVWLNFPFSDPPPWVEKVMREADRVSSITVLSPNDSSVRWWKDLIRFVDAHAAWPRRLHFPLPGQARGSPPGPVALWYVGRQSNRWRRVMASFGCTTQAGHVDGERPLFLPKYRKKPRLIDDYLK